MGFTFHDFLHNHALRLLALPHNPLLPLYWRLLHNRAINRHHFLDLLGNIPIRPVRRNPREGWAEDARRLAEQGDDVLVWPEFANEADNQLVW